MLGSRGHGRMAPVTGVLQCRITGSFGRMGCEDDDDKKMPFL